jgi:hypothetical protein
MICGISKNKFNSESVFELVCTSNANVDWGGWGSGRDRGNSVNQMVGPRSFNEQLPE